MGTKAEEAQAKLARAGLTKAYDSRRTPAKKLTQRLLSGGKWSKETLAKHIGVVNGTIEKWATGTSAPTSKHFKALQEAGRNLPPRYGRARKKSDNGRIIATRKVAVRPDPPTFRESKPSFMSGDVEALLQLAAGLTDGDRLAMAIALSHRVMKDMADRQNGGD